jgi:nitroreductase
VVSGEQDMDKRLKLIMTRRSIRRYQDKPVEDGDVEALLRAAMAAPSAGNCQPWHFVVVRERETMRRIMQSHPYAKMLDHAPVCIAVLADPSLQRHAGMWVQDCSAATQNILLAAHAIGLGAVWLGVYPESERTRAVQEILGLPAGIECLSLVALGHPAERPAAADRYDAGRVHSEAW